MRVRRDSCNFNEKFTLNPTSCEAPFPTMGEPTDVQSTIKNLNRALPLQARDAVAIGIAAGTLPGPAGVALGPALRAIAVDEMRDVEGLAGRIAALGGTPAAGTPDTDLPKTWQAALKRLVEMQQETLESLVEAIPAGADDVEGEATEHLLEHVVSRKRSVVELLERALR